MDIKELNRKDVDELMRIGGDLEVTDTDGLGKEDLVERIIQRQVERGGQQLRGRHPRPRRGWLRLHAPPRPHAQPGRHLRQLQPCASLRPARGRPRGGHPATRPRTGEKYWGLVRVDSVNGVDPETARRRPHFDALTPIHPIELINLESDPKNLSQRLVNLVNPSARASARSSSARRRPARRCCSRPSPTASRTNYPDILLMVALIGERPEEVTDMRRSVKGEVISSTFDEPTENHTHVAEMALEIAKRQVEAGRDVVILLDSITRLSRAYNLALPPSGRTLTGGIDPVALYPPKRFFGAARKLEEGGSLTIIATCLVDTGSRMDDVIYEEFKGTGNSELILDRKLSEKRIFPSIDVQRSGTRREELLLEEPVLKMVWTMRRMLSAVGTNEGIELLLNRPRKTESNAEFLSSLTRQAASDARRGATDA